MQLPGEAGVVCFSHEARAAMCSPWSSAGDSHPGVLQRPEDASGLFQRLLDLSDLGIDDSAAFADRAEVGGVRWRRGQLAQLLLELVKAGVQPGGRGEVDFVDPGLGALANERGPIELGEEHGKWILARDREARIEDELIPVAVMHGLATGVLGEDMHSGGPDRRTAQDRRPAVCAGVSIVAPGRHRRISSEVLRRRDEAVEQALAIVEIGEPSVDPGKLGTKLVAGGQQPGAMAVDLGALGVCGALESGGCGRGSWRHRIGLRSTADRVLHPRRNGHHHDWMSGCS